MKIKNITLLFLIGCGVSFMAQATLFNVVDTSEESDSAAMSFVFKGGAVLQHMFQPLDRFQFQRNTQLKRVHVIYVFGNDTVLYAFDLSDLKIGTTDDQDVVKIDIQNKGVCEVIKGDGTRIKVKGVWSHTSSMMWPKHRAS